MAGLSSNDFSKAGSQRFHETREIFVGGNPEDDGNIINDSGGDCFVRPERFAFLASSQRRSGSRKVIIEGGAQGAGCRRAVGCVKNDWRISLENLEATGPTGCGEPFFDRR